MKIPYMEKEQEEVTPDDEQYGNSKNVKTIVKDNGNGKETKKEVASENEYYTGNRSKDVIVHVLQDRIEVDKPIKSKIYQQSVEWNRRQWPIVSKRFWTDYNGTHHQMVDVNDMAVLSFEKDHADTCKACGGKMTIDTKESRTLGRRGIFQAIWGLDNTRMILLIVMMIGAMAMAGGFFYAYSEDAKHKAQLEGQKVITSKQQVIIEQYQNMTGIHIG